MSTLKFFYNFEKTHFRSVATVNAANNLLEKGARLFLVEFSFVANVIEQLAIWHVLHDEEQIGR